MLGQMRRHGRVELLVVLPDGSKTLIPAAWTDLGDDGDGPAERVAALTLGSLADLLHADTLVSTLRARGEDPGAQAARQSPCKEDFRAACAAEFDAGPGTGATPKPDRRPPATAGHRGDQDIGRVDRQGRRRGGDRGGRR